MDHSQHGGIISYVRSSLLHVSCIRQGLTPRSTDVYTAATVLIAGRLRSAIVAEITEPTVTRSWNLALEILRKYQESSTSARRCIAALEILYDRVVSEGHEPHHRVTSTLSSEQQSQSFPLLPAPNSLDEIYLGEGIDSTVFETFNLADPQDMSWLHSVPSNLY